MRDKKTHIIFQCVVMVMMALVAMPGTCRVQAIDTPVPSVRPAAVKSGRYSFKLKKNGSRQFVLLREVARFYGMRYATFVDMEKNHGCILAGANSRLEFRTRSFFFKINGIQASLSYQIAYIGNELLVEVTDFTQFIDPMMRPWLVARLDVKSIMLDPGHGGSDHGAESVDVLEKNMNLQMAQKIGTVLTKRGYHVLYTRTGDSTLSLQGRSKAAAKFKPSLFLSIHCNSAEDKNIHGIEVFIANPPGTPSFGTSNIGKKAASTNFNTTNAVMAYCIQRALLKATDSVDRGIKRKQFYVVRETPAPSILLEIGFLSNEVERKKMLKNEYQDKIAVAVCDAVDTVKKTLAVAKTKGK